MKDMTIDEKIKVMEAWRDGYAIQFYNPNTKEWEDCEEEPLWAFDSEFYRIKPDTDFLKNYKDAFYNSTNTICPHKELVALDCVVPISEQEFGGPYRDCEFIFTVPLDWLVSYLDDLAGRREWSRSKAIEWLNDTYTSEDSENVFWEAIKDGVVVTYTEV